MPFSHIFLTLYSSGIFRSNATSLSVNTYDSPRAALLLSHLHPSYKCIIGQNVLMPRGYIATSGFGLNLTWLDSPAYVVGHARDYLKIPSVCTEFFLTRG